MDYLRIFWTGTTCVRTWRPVMIVKRVRFYEACQCVLRLSLGTSVRTVVHECDWSIMPWRNLLKNQPSLRSLSARANA